MTVDPAKYAKDYKASLPPQGQRSLLQSWMALPAKTRLRVSLAMCIVGGAGIVISDFLEKQIPPSPPSDTAT